MIEKVLEKLQEAAKVLHMDASHSALRDNLQVHLSAHHAAANPDAAYYNHPYVRDVYGDNESGTVVYSKQGKHTMANFKKNKDGGYNLSNHKAVKQAYVADNDADDQRESLVFVDGETLTLAAKESTFNVVGEETIDLRESAFDSQGIGLIKLIAPGHGSTGYYSKEVLKDAATNGIFSEGLHMYIDHQTEAEESDRPENSVRNLAAKLVENAKWDDNGPAGPGLYAKAQAYSDFVPFLNERANDIGVSIRAFGTATKGQVGGRINNIVKKLAGAKSVDFVTRAGAGGKLIPLLESYRASHKDDPKGRQPAAKENNQMKVEIEESELKKLQESAAQVPTLILNQQRTNEQLARINARESAAGLVAKSGLPESAQRRVLGFLTGPNSTLPLTEAGVLDNTKFESAIKAACEAEAAYLKESGIGTTHKVKESVQAPTADEQKAFNESLDKWEDTVAGLTSELTGIKRK